MTSNACARLLRVAYDPVNLSALIGESMSSKFFAPTTVAACRQELKILTKELTQFQGHLDDAIDVFEEASAILRDAETPDVKDVMKELRQTAKDNMTDAKLDIRDVAQAIKECHRLMATFIKTPATACAKAAKVIHN